MRVSRVRGFTLVELMMVIAVIGILAAIAVPQYNEYLRRAKRTAAKSHLIDISSRQQQYLLDRRQYAASVADLGMTTPTDVSDSYTITIVPTAPPAPPAFVVSATPIVGGLMASDVTLQIQSDGTKLPASAW